MGYGAPTKCVCYYNKIQLVREIACVERVRVSCVMREFIVSRLGNFAFGKKSSTRCVGSVRSMCCARGQMIGLGQFCSGFGILRFSFDHDRHSEIRCDCDWGTCSPYSRIDVISAEIQGGMHGDGNFRYGRNPVRTRERCVWKEESAPTRGEAAHRSWCPLEAGQSWRERKPGEIH